MREGSSCAPPSPGIRPFWASVSTSVRQLVCWVVFTFRQHLLEPVKCSFTPISSWTSDHGHANVQSPQGAPSCLSSPLAKPTCSCTVPPYLRCSNKLKVIFCFTSSRSFLRQKQRGRELLDLDRVSYLNNSRILCASMKSVSRDLFFNWNIVDVQCVTSCYSVSRVIQLHSYILFFIFFMVYCRMLCIVPCAITVGPCCLSILYVIVCLHLLIPASQSFPPAPSLLRHLQACSLSLSLFCR